MNELLEQHRQRLVRHRDYIRAQMKLQVFTPTRTTLELKEIEQELERVDAALRHKPNDAA